jgi:beta-phosphoglucomutase
MVGAVIFDFDGVIVDSEPLHQRAFNRVAGQFGVQISDEQYFGRFLGLNDREVFEMLVEENDLSEQTGPVAHLVARKTKIFQELAAREGTIIEGVAEFLAMLKDKAVPMAICSGALDAEIRLILAGAKLSDYFEAIVAADHVAKGKPDPQGFLMALEQLNRKLSRSIEPRQCIAVEDSRWGLQAAKAAGMHPVAVTNTYGPGELALAERVVESLAELAIAELEGLCA